MSLLRFVGWSIAQVVFGALTLAAFEWMLNSGGGLWTALSVIALLFCLTMTIFTVIASFHRW